MGKSSFSHPPQAEVSKESSPNQPPEKNAPELVSKEPETLESIPEAVEVSRELDISAKKEEIKAEPVEETPPPTAPAAQAVSPVEGYVSGADLKNLENLPREQQVKYLTEVVYQKGLDRAIATVRRLNDPYLLDLLHDTLVDDLFQKLKKPAIGKK